MSSKKSAQSTGKPKIRMRQFFETYVGDKKVSPLVTQLSWTHHLIIMGQCKRPEEREFCVKLAIREGWGKRELERQLQTALFERAVLNPPKVAPVVRQIHPEAESIRHTFYALNAPSDIESEQSKRKGGGDD